MSKDDDKSNGASGSETNDDAGSEEGEAKRTVTRKPIWVCIPETWAPVSDAEGNPVVGDDGEVRTEPTSYTIHKCEPKKKAVLSVLAQHNIDTTNIGHVIMFRADRLDFAVSQQLNIRW
jgi:hypothetical protein